MIDIAFPDRVTLADAAQTETAPAILPIPVIRRSPVARVLHVTAVESTTADSTLMTESAGRVRGRRRAAAAFHTRPILELRRRCSRHQKTLLRNKERKANVKHTGSVNE